MSEIVVQKFGGTSVGTVDRIDSVAEIIKNASKSNKIVVVVSAMGGETNRLVDLAKAFGDDPDKREFDALVSTGETVSSALLTMALHSKGVKAKSFSASQISMRTTSSYSKAKILDVDAKKILDVVENDTIPIITGFFIFYLIFITMPDFATVFWKSITKFSAYLSWKKVINNTIIEWLLFEVIK